MLTISGPLSVVVTSSSTRWRTSTVAASVSSVSTSTNGLSSCVVRAVGLARMWSVGLRRESDVGLGVIVVVLLAICIVRGKTGVVVLA